MNKVALTPIKKSFGPTPVGGIFYVTKPQARIYIKLGLAKYADEEPAALTQPVIPDEPAPVVEPEVKPEKPKRKRYQRRDMRAEE